MLLHFSVENYRSIRDTQNLLLTASQRIKPEDRRGAVFPIPGTQEQEAALPAVALYGSNASGKSNILEALVLMRFLIAKSHAERRPVSPLPQQPFLLDHDSPAQPTRLECTFTLSHAKELISNGTSTKEVQPVYTYGFKHTKKEICEEWLYQEGAEAEQDSRLLFRRTTLNQEITLEVGDQLSGENENIRKLTRPNSLFLSAAAQNNHSQLLGIYEYFSGMILGHHEKLPFPRMGGPCQATRNPSTTDFLTVRRQPTGRPCSIFRGAHLLKTQSLLENP